MLSRRLTPGQWRNLPKADRLEMMAYEYRRDQRRWELFHRADEVLPDGWNTLAQIIIWLSDI